MNNTNQNFTLNIIAEQCFYSLKLSVKESTLATYRYIYKTYIEPELGEKHIIPVTIQDYRKLMHTLSDNYNFAGAVTYVNGANKGNLVDGIAMLAKATHLGLVTNEFYPISQITFTLKRVRQGYQMADNVEIRSNAETPDDNAGSF